MVDGSEKLNVNLPGDMAPGVMMKNLAMGLADGARLPDSMWNRHGVHVCEF